MVLGKDGGSAQLSFTDDTILAGRADPTSNRTSPVALADRADARLQALEQQVLILTAAVTALTATVAGVASAAGSRHDGCRAEPASRSWRGARAVRADPSDHGGRCPQGDRPAS